ncbi:MAG TPA: hypothetical protein VMD98_10200 [Bryocella sp.]|nr:hypothetical protein [Bryocella sp.]
MPTSTKSSKKAVNGADTAKSEVAEVFAPFYVNTVNRVAELQKSSLDAVAEQTTEFVAAWKKAASYFPVPTPTFFFDVFGQAVQTAVETQKSAIDLAVEQTEAVAEIAKQRADAYSGIAETTTEAFKSAVSRSVEAQKKVLEFAAQQNKAVWEATKKQIGNGPASIIADTIERGTKTVIDAQKSILDATTSPFVS